MNNLKTYKSEATPKAVVGGIPVFCSHDAIVPLGKLVPNPKNPNTHSDEQVRLLGKIIQATGWRQPITVSTRSGFIVKGHGRLMAARMAGLTEAPVDYQEYANEAEEYTDPNHRALLFNGGAPQILLTDPPYCSGGFQENGKKGGSIGTDTKFKWDKGTPMIANDTLSTRGFQALVKQAINGTPCTIAYIFTDWRMWIYLFDLVEGSGFGVRNMIVWNKNSIGMGVGWRTKHELIMFGLKTKPNFDKRKGYGNVLDCKRSLNPFHPTQKPVELIEMILDNTAWAKGVYDPFGGSGTTLIAAEKKNQEAYIMELEPKYVDTIVRRYILATGKKDVRCIRGERELAPTEFAEILDEIDGADTNESEE